MLKGKLLIIDDNQELLIALKLLLNEYFDITTLNNPNLIHTTIEQQSFHVFILDMNFIAGQNSGNEGFYWMQQIFNQDADAVIVLITAYGDVQLSVKAMKKGATDFIQKPWVDEKLVATVLAAYKLSQSKREIKKLKDKHHHITTSSNLNPSLFLGKSLEMNKLWKTIEKVAGTDVNILLTGENGTGKEIIAREIHRLSKRSKELFVKVDLSSLSNTLFESELFGYRKGAFTDAKEHRPGRIEIASEGSLFLDEIGNINLNQQSKLLSVLQNRVITRLGDHKERRVDIRLISATNKPLKQMVNEGLFREDLLYRINTIELEVPPLRKRTEDIPLLLKHFLQIYTLKYSKQELECTKAHIQSLTEYDWPGNIREFEHLVEKAVILEDANVFFLKESFKSQTEDLSRGSLNLEENQKRLILMALEKVRWNYSLAAKELGVSRKTLYNKLKKYDL